MAGITNDPFTGNPLLYRDSQYASKNFKIEGGSLATSILPKPKFLFFVQFVRAVDAPDQRFGLSRGDGPDGIVFQVKTIDRPKFNIKTETLHQYNKKRVIQTQIEYQNMTIAFHDDVSDQVMRFWAEYYGFYYGDGRKESSQEWTSADIANGQFEEGAASRGWGYKGNFENPKADGMHFLESINILQFYGGRYTSMSFIHPKITVFDHDQNDYADGREGSGIRMSFDYEGVIYNLTKQEVNPIVIGEFGSRISEGPDGIALGQISSTAIQFGFSNTYYNIGEIVRAGIPRSGGQTTLEPTNDDIPTQSVPPTGQEETGQRLGSFALPISGPELGLTNALLEQSRRRIRAGTSVLSPNRLSFGGNALSGITNKVIDLVTATSLAGKIPSPDLIQKAAGVKDTINAFGNVASSSPSTERLLANIPTAINSGLDSSKISRAGSILSEVVSSGEQQVGPGQTTFADPSTTSRFKRSFATASVLAQTQGLVDDIAEFPDEITHASADAPVMFNKLPNGTFQATEIGNLVLQTLRSPTSALGINRPKMPWVNPDSVNTTKRALAAENNDDSLNFAT